MKKKKIGLALGAGGAKGLAHIGILKMLHKHKIYPDYLAGTSMGAVIGALYAAGHSPEEIEELAKTTDWKKIVDFTVPKSGIIRGKLIERKIRKLVFKKKFSQLRTPLRVVTYNLTQKEKVIFAEGDVASAVHASLSIPGIFNPTKINQHYYIDGAVSNPTPFDVVKEMGADIVIAVDLYKKEKTEKKSIAREESLVKELRDRFIAEELLNLKNLIFPDRWPKIIRKMLIKLFDLLLYPARVLRILAGKELPSMTKVMYETLTVLTNNLAKERITKANVDLKVTPTFNHLTWMDFDQVTEFIKIGEKAMSKSIAKLKKKIG